jgi:predicted RNase H-like nuclease (RuvC/YqgF family)
MHDEKILMESRSLRDSLAARTDALDKVKALELLPDGVHVTTEIVADYFVIHRDAIKSIVRRHREELTGNGMVVLRGADLRKFERVNLTPSKSSYPQGRAHLTLYSRRTVLNVAMLLRDSSVARRVRAYLLDAEERARQPQQASVSLDKRVTNVEAAMADIGPALRDLGHVIHRMAVRLENVERRVEHVDRRVERMDRRLDNTERVVCAMSERLADVAADLKELRERPVPRPSWRRHRGLP